MAAAYGEMERSPDKNRNSSHMVPYRDVTHLYVHASTLQCALQRHCISCAYKIGCFDVALDQAFTTAVPNVRPDLCPRHDRYHDPQPQALAAVSTNSLSFDYTLGMRVLTVGDGDLSFSVAMARRVGPTGCVVATSYETQETMMRVYGEDRIRQMLQELQQHSSKHGNNNVSVHFQVDATRLGEFLEHHYSLVNNNDRRKKFDRIVWNFPCTCTADIGAGQDGQNQHMSTNQRLVRAFVAQARNYLNPKGGQIHMNHKTKPPYNHWKMELVATRHWKTLDANEEEECINEEWKDASSSSSSSSCCCCCCCSPSHPLVVYYYGRIVLDQNLFPPYAPRKALCRKSFPVHDACTYVFGLMKNGGIIHEDRKEDDEQEEEMGEEEKDKILHPVTIELIQSIRNTFLRLSSKNTLLRQTSPKRGPASLPRSKKKKKRRRMMH